MTISSNQEAQAPVQESPAQGKTKEDNLVLIRKELERERQEKAQLAQRLLDLEKSKSHPSLDDDDDFSDEPYIDPRTFKKKLNKTREEIKTQTQSDIQQAVQAAIAEERRKGYLEKNSDFNDLMQNEVIERFAQKHPGVAQAILKMPDGFERQQLVYEAIKATGAHLKDKPKESIQDVVDRNRKTPFYQPGGVGSAPYAAAGDFSPSGKKNAYDQMQALKSRLRLS